MRVKTCTLCTQKDTHLHQIYSYHEAKLSNNLSGFKVSPSGTDWSCQVSLIDKTEGLDFRANRQNSDIWEAMTLSEQSVVLSGGNVGIENHQSHQGCEDCPHLQLALDIPRYYLWERWETWWLWSFLASTKSAKLLKYVPGDPIEFCTWRSCSVLYLEILLRYVPGDPIEICTWRFCSILYMEILW